MNLDAGISGKGFEGKGDAEIKRELAEKIVTASFRNAELLTAVSKVAASHFRKLSSAAVDPGAFQTFRESLLATNKSREQETLLNELSTEHLLALAKTLTSVDDVTRGELKSLYQTAIKSAKGERKDALHACYWHILTPQEKESISKQALKKLKIELKVEKPVLEKGSARDLQSVERRYAGLKRLSIPDMQLIAKEVFAVDPDEKLIDRVNLLLLQAKRVDTTNVLEFYKAARELKARILENAKPEFDNALKMVSQLEATFGKKCFLMCQVRLEEVRKEQEHLIEDDLDETHGKQKELLDTLQELRRQLSYISASYEYAKEAEGSYSFKVDSEDPDQWPIYFQYGNVATSAKDFISAFWRWRTKDPDATLKSVHFVHTKTSVEEDKKAITKTLDEIDRLSQQISDLLQPPIHSIVDHLRTFDTAYSHMADERGEQSLQSLGRSSYSSYLTCRLSLNQAALECSKLGTKDNVLEKALSARQKLFQASLEEGHFMQRYKECALAEIQECLYYMKTPEEMRYSSLILQHIRKEVEVFKAALEAIQFSQDVPKLVAILDAVTRAEKIVGTLKPPEMIDVLKIARERPILSPTKKWLQTKNAPSIFESEITKRALSILFPLMELSSTAIQEYQKTKSLLATQEAVETLRATPMRRGPNSLLDMLIQSSEFLHLDEWTKEKTAIFLMNLSPHERELFNALRNPGILDELSYQNYMALLESASIEANSKLLLNAEYRPNVSADYHRALVAKREPVGVDFAQKFMDFVHQVLPRGHDAMERLIQTRPELLTMPEQKFQEIMSTQSFAQGDLMCLHLLRSREHLHALNAVTLKQFFDFYQLKPETVKQVVETLGLSRTQSTVKLRYEPPSDQTIPTREENIQIESVSQNAPIHLQYGSRGTPSDFVTTDDLHYMQTGGLSTARSIDTVVKTVEVASPHLTKRVRVERQRVDDTRGLVRLKQYVEGKSRIPIQEQDLAHIMSDEPISGSQLESHGHMVGVKRYRHELSALQTLMKLDLEAEENPILRSECEQVGKLVSKLEKAEELDPTLPFDKYEENLRRQYEALAIGDSLIIPGGWSGYKGKPGHYVTYELFKEPDGRARIRYHDLGGAAGGNGRIVFEKDGKILSKSMPYVEYRFTFEDLWQIRQFSDDTYLKHLYLCMHREEYWDFVGREVDIHLPFQMIGQKLDTLVDPNEVMYLQYGGVCTHASIMAFVGASLPGTSTENHLWFQIRLHTLHEYFSTKPDYSQIAFLTTTLQKFSEDVATLLNQQAITIDEADYAQSLIRDFRQQLARNKSESELTSSLQADTHASTWSTSEPHLPTVSKENFREEFPRSPHLDIVSWKVPSTWRQFQSEMERHVSGIDATYQAKNYKQVILDAGKLMHKIAESEKLYELKTSSIDKAAYRKMLDSLMVQLTYSINAQIRQEPYHAHEIQAEVYFTMLACAFAMQELLDFGLSVIPKDDYVTLLGNTADFLVDDPVWNDMSQRIRAKVANQITLGRQQEPLPPTGSLINIRPTWHEFHSFRQPGGEHFRYETDSLIAHLANYIAADEHKALRDKVDQEIAKMGLDQIQDVVITDAVRASVLLSQEVRVNGITWTRGRVDTTWKNPGNLLPLEFRQARDAWYYLGALSKSGLTVLENADQVEQGKPFFTLSVTKTGFPHVWWVFVAVPEHSKQSFSSPDAFYESKASDGVYVQPFNHLQNGQQVIPTTIRDTFYDQAGEILRTDPNKAVLMSHKEAVQANESLTVQEIREWKAVFSSKSTQVQKAISLIERSPETLSDKNKRQLALNALLAPGLLEESFSTPFRKGEPLKRFLQILEENIAKAEKMKDRETLLVLISLSRQVTSRLRAINQPLTSALQERLELAIENALTQMRDSKSELLLERLQLYATHYGESIPPKKFEDVLTGIVSFSILHHLDPEDQMTIRQRALFSQSLKTLEPTLAFIIQNYPKMMNEALKRIGALQKEEPTWQSKGYPIFAARCGERELVFNVQTGQLQGVHVDLPQEFRAHPHFKAVFTESSAEFKTIKITEKTYRVASKGKDYLIISTKDSDLVILQKAADGKLLQQMNLSQASIANHLGDRVNAWLETGKTEQELSSQERVSPLELSSRRVLLSDPESGAFRYVLENNAIYQLDATGKKSSTVLENLENTESPWHFLANFEDPDHIQLWVDQNSGKISKMELRRFDLEFNQKEVAGVTLLESEKFPGYSWDGTMRQDATRALVLKNFKTGDVLEVYPSHGLKERDAWQERKYKSDTVNPGFYTYRASKDGTSSIPEPKMMNHTTVEALIHLAEMKLWNHDYQGSLNSLRNLPTPHQFSPAEQKRLEQLIKSVVRTSDTTPYGHNIILYAAYLRVHDLALRGIPPNFLRTLAQEYGHYLEHDSRMSLTPLTIFEEKEILNLLKSQLDDKLWQMRSRQIDAKMANFPVVEAPEPMLFTKEMCPSFEEIQDPLREQLLPELPIKTSEKPSEVMQKIDDAMDRLERELQSLHTDSTSDSSSLEAKSQKLHASYMEFRSELKGIEIQSMDEFERIRNTLVQENASDAKEMTLLRDKIVKLAHHDYAGKEMQVTRAVNIEAGIFRKKTVDELVDLMRDQDTEAFRRFNPALSVEESVELAEMLFQYLMKATANQARQRAIGAIGELIRADSKQLQEIALVKVMDSARQRRSFDPKLEIDLLIYEYRQDVLMRSNQYRDLIVMSKVLKPGDFEARQRILERIMGYGKTYVISPNILNSILSQGLLGAVMLPKPLFASQVAEVSLFLEKAHGIKSFSLQISPTIELNAEILQSMLTSLQTAIVEKRALWLTPEHIFTFALKAILLVDKWHQSARTDEKDIQAVSLIRDIFDFMRKNLHLTVDEATQVFAPLVQHILQLGEQKPFTREILEAMTALSLALEDPEVSQILDMPYMHSHVSEGLERKTKAEFTFSQERYESMVIPKLAQKVVDRLVASESLGLKKFFSSLSPDIRAQVISYLVGDESQEAFWQQIQDPTVRAALNHLRAAILDVLPQALGKKIFQEFGAIPEEFWSKIDPALKDVIDVSIPIPWNGANNPTIGSRFLHPLAEVTYTLMHYRNQGVNVRDVKQELSSLHQGMQKEMESNPKAEVSELSSYKRLVRLVGQNSGIDLLQLKDADYETATKLINSSPERVMLFCRDVYLPRLKQSTLVARLGPQFLGLITKMTQGFTGTLAGEEIFPEAVSAEYDPSVYVKTVAALAVKDTRVTSLNVRSFAELKSTKEKVELLYNRKQAHEDVIDLAGIFAGASNEEVADEMLRHPRWKDRTDPLLAVGFYDREGNLKMRVKLGENRFETHDFDPAKPAINKENYIFFWDQMHFTGSNVRRSLVAKAIVPISLDTLSYDNLQALWRLRELDKGQSVEFVFSEEVERAVRELIPETKGRDLSFIDLFCFFEANQLERQGVEAVASFVQKLDVLAQRLAVEAIANHALPLETLATIWPDLRGAFFGTIMEGDARYFPLNKEQPKEQFLQKKLEDTLQVLEAIGKNPAANEQLTLDPLIRLAKSLKEKYAPRVPDKIAFGAQDVNAASFMFQQANQKSEQKMNQQMQMLEQLSALEKNPPKPNVLLVTSEGKLFSRDFYVPQKLDAIQSANSDVVKQTMTEDANQKKVYVGEGINFPTLSSKVVGVAEALAISPELAFLQSSISPNLLATFNFMPLYPKTSLLEHTFVPYDLSQHSVENTLLVIDKATKQHKLVLLNGYDDEYFQYELQKSDRSSSSGGIFSWFQRAQGTEREIILCLLDREGHVVSQSEETSSYLAENASRIRELLVQAKFLDGEVNYTNEELATLRSYLSASKDLGKLRTAFESYLLFRKDRNAALYPTSTLYKLFQSLQNG